jgi:hypothetical protein
MRLFKRELILSLIFIIGADGFAGTAYAQKSEVGGRVRSVNQAAEATIILNEQFVNSFLGAMFTHLREPEFPLSLASNEFKDEQPVIFAAYAESSARTQACASMIVLERERNGVKTAVRFEDGRIVAPLAFSGSYSAGLLGCVSFNGVANSVVTLEYDRGRQALLARVQVTDVQLNGLPRLGSSLLVNMVQNSVDKKFNPYELFRAEQVSAIVPIKAAGGSLRLRPTDMRPEIVQGTLRIYLTYEFVKAEGK